MNAFQVLFIANSFRLHLVFKVIYKLPFKPTLESGRTIKRSDRHFPLFVLSVDVIRMLWESDSCFSPTKGTSLDCRIDKVPPDLSM